MNNGAEDEIIELSANYALKLLIKKRSFLEEWERRLANRLEMVEESRNFSVFESKGTEEIHNSISELYSTLKNVNKQFVINVDLSSCSNLSPHTNRDAGILFETGLKVERICTIDIGEKVEQFAKQMGTACRRLNYVLKSFIKNMSGAEEIHVSSYYGVSTRICDLCYTVSSEIVRFLEEANLLSGERRRIEEDGRQLNEMIDTFNEVVVGKMEKISNKLKNKSIKMQKLIPNGKMLANSVQNGIRPVSSGEFRRTHHPGSIAASIVTKHRGYLISDTLKKARAKVYKPCEKPKMKRSLENEEEEVMKTANEISKGIIEELKQSLNVGPDDKIWLGVKM